MEKNSFILSRVSILEIISNHCSISPVMVENFQKTKEYVSITKNTELYLVFSISEPPATYLQK